MRIRSRPPKFTKIIIKDFSFTFGVIWSLFTSIFLYAFFTDEGIINDNGLTFKTIFASAAMLLFISVGYVMIFFAIKRARRIIRLFKTGMSSKATITDMHITGRTNGRPTSVTVKYYFTYQNNKNYQGQTHSVPYKNTTKIKPGDEINILYNRNNPDESVWIDGYC